MTDLEFYNMLRQKGLDFLEALDKISKEAGLTTDDMFEHQYNTKEKALEAFAKWSLKKIKEENTSV